MKTHITNSNRRMVTKSVFLLAMMALGGVAFAKPKVEYYPTLQESVQTPDTLNNKDEDYYTCCYHRNAEFPGGDEAMYKWISNHLKYPEECKAKGIQGRVSLRFVVDADGSITDVKAVRSPDEALSQEAIRVVSAMPKWKPATQMDKPVHCNYRLPITFRLSPSQTEQTPKE